MQHSLTADNLPGGGFVVVDEQRAPRTAQVRGANPAPPPHDCSSPTLEGSDRARIEAIVTKEYPGLRLLLARRTGDAQVAADLLNEAFCTTWEKWQTGQIQDPQHIVGYIFQVAMNLLRNRKRLIAERPEKRADARVLEALPSSQPEADESIEAHIAERVRELIRSMGSCRDRTALVRFYLDEQDRESICRELQMTPAQLAKVLHRARTRLRTLLESDGVRRSDLFSLSGVL